MCGIVGAVAQRNIVPVLIEACGGSNTAATTPPAVAVAGGDGARRRGCSASSAPARVADLEARSPPSGIAGTDRHLATRAGPRTARRREVNAHPHISGGEIAVVHNGIIENHEALRDAPRRAGLRVRHRRPTPRSSPTWSTRTGTRRRRRPVAARCSGAIAELHGAYAIAVVCDARARPRGRRAQRQPAGASASGDGENFLASDASALLPVTRRVVYLEDGDVADIAPRRRTRSSTPRGERGRAPGASPSRRRRAAVELGPYRHFMQKEIFEQPRAVADTLERRRRASARRSSSAPGAERCCRRSTAVLILACGTSYHAGLVARYWLEAIAGMPCSVEIASEYRYRDSVPNPRHAGRRRSRSRARPPTRWRR